MDVSVVKKTIETEVFLGREDKQAQVGAEAITPGAGREEIEVLMESAEWIIEGAEAQEGRVVVDGTIVCQAVYRQGDASIRAVQATTGVSEAINFPEATEKSILYAKPIIEETTARYDNGRILFTVSYRLIVSAYALTNVDVIDSVAENADLETQFEEITSVKLSAESSADTLVTQEVALPKQLDARVALMDWAQARVTEATPDLGGMQIKGEVQAETLIGTGVPARPVALVKVTMPFEQLVELPQWLTERVTNMARVQKLETRIDQDADGEAALKLEANVRVLAYADGADEVNALTDIYATGTENIATESETVSYMAGTATSACTESFRGTLMLPDGAPGVGAVLASRMRAVMSDITESDNVVTVEGWLDVKALYLPGGSEKIYSVRGELPFSFACPGPMPDPATSEIEILSAEAVALMSDRLDVRCQMRFQGRSRDMRSLSVVESVAENGMIARPRGLIIVWPTDTDSAWTIAKRYCVPPARIGVDVEEGRAVILRL